MSDECKNDAAKFSFGVERLQTLQRAATRNGRAHAELIDPWLGQRFERRNPLLLINSQLRRIKMKKKTLSNGQRCLSPRTLTMSVTSIFA